jgi:hypothetical protein
MVLTDTEDMLEFLDGMEVKTLNPTPKAGEYEIEIFKPEGSVTVLEIIISNIPDRGDDKITYIHKEFTWLEYNEKTKECILYEGHQRKLNLILRNGQELLRDFKLNRILNHE